MHFLKRIRSSGAARIAAASYFSFASLAASTFVSIPVAVYYLDRAEIGLWAVVNQVVGYLLWMDLGVGQATGRKMTDAVVNRDAQELNRWWSATRFVLLVQAGLVLLIGLFGHPWALALFNIPESFAPQASTLVIGAVILAAISLPMKGVPGLMMAENRFHWIPLVQGTAPWVSLGIFTLMLSRGHGVTSYLWGMAVSQFLTWVAFWFLVRTSTLPPHWDSKGLTRARLKSLFSFSLNLGGIALINSIINSLPAVVISRLSTGGLAMIPTYNFTTKVPVMGANLVQRTGHSFYPGLQRMYVQGDLEVFRLQFIQSAQTTLAFGLIAAGGVLMATRTIVELLAGKQFFGGSEMVIFLAMGMIITPLASLYQTLRQIAGNMGKTLLFSLIKVILALALAFPAFRHFGLTGLCAVFMLVPLIDVAYGYYKGAPGCGFSPAELTLPIARWATAGLALILLGGVFIRIFPSYGITIGLGSKLIHLPGWSELVAGGALLLTGLIACIHQLTRMSHPNVKTV